ncbi:hypothetical protein IHQ68_15535 [Chelatococcus sambhunathii]|uniref:Uncharacterized protein n=1 Tax=Chelatococcus sambhunathii TaxID=363953 RepID=A0ABU1DIW1_9HYPH|nr:hypothetical protein [Chelatococcus sambhunathii]MDR4308034.1 hypothetical protein [Chelatococcus sambhunathii]
MFAPFEGPRSLVTRSERHANELSDAIKVLQHKVRIYFVPVGNDGQFEQYFLQFEPQPPIELAVILKDAISNLRSALDIVVCDVARLRNKPASEMSQVKFPFGKDEAGLNEAFKRAKLDSDVNKAIRAIHPINGHNVWIRDLHDLDIIAKHRTVLPVFATANSRLPFRVPIEMQHAFLSMGVDLANSNCPWTQGSTMTLPKGVDPRSHFRPRGDMTISLPRELPFGEKNLEVVLRELRNGVSVTIGFFETLFGANSDPAVRDPLRAQLGL